MFFMITFLKKTHMNLKPSKTYSQIFKKNLAKFTLKKKKKSSPKIHNIYVKVIQKSKFSKYHSNQVFQDIDSKLNPQKL